MTSISEICRTFCEKNGVMPLNSINWHFGNLINFARLILQMFEALSICQGVYFRILETWPSHPSILPFRDRRLKLAIFTFLDSFWDNCQFRNSNFHLPPGIPSCRVVELEYVSQIDTWWLWRTCPPCLGKYLLSDLEYPISWTRSQLFRTLLLAFWGFDIMKWLMNQSSVVDWGNAFSLFV